MYIGSNQSRREFLRYASHFAAAGTGASLACNLGLIGHAAATTADDYKALVCIFLYGGNDDQNTLPPYDPENYNLYLAARQSIALDRSQLAATLLSTDTDLGGRQFALHPSLAPLRPIFDDARMAVLLNVGTLLQPINKVQYQKLPTMAPPRLFSHVDQQNFFQTGSFTNPTVGWGGMIGDLLQAYNGIPSLTCISAAGRAAFVSGTQSGGYSIGVNGAVELFDGSTTVADSPSIYASMLDIMKNSGRDMFSREYAKVTSRALALSDNLGAALDTAPDAGFALFPSGNSLASQLKIVARMIASTSQTSAKRQVFFVSLGGFDTHSGIPERHPALLATLATALKAFYDTTVALGISEKVTTFTASDFGRALASNGDGSDHGWGAAHFVVGGAVKGRRFYGTPPAVGINTNDDVGRGRLIPTTSVDQYAATLASWFGIAVSDLSLLLPNIVNFDAAKWNVGFV